METISRPRASRVVTVRCDLCGGPQEITDRQYRRRQQEGRPYHCSLCRRTTVHPPNQTHKNFWLNRFSQDEINEMARAIWG